MLKRHAKKMGSRGTPGPPVATPLDFVVVIIFPYTKPDFEARNQPNRRLCWKPIDDNHSASLESVRADSDSCPIRIPLKPIQCSSNVLHSVRIMVEHI